MKKILVVFLVLAVTAGVFAQEGEWNLIGGAQVTARIDLEAPSRQDGAGPDDKEAVVGASGFWVPYDGWGMSSGYLEIQYTKGDFSSGIGIHQRDRLGSWSKYEVDNFGFYVEGNLVNIMHWGGAEIGRLGGWYKFLDEMILLEVGLKARDKTYWDSDMTGAFGGTFPGDAVHHDFGDGGAWGGIDNAAALLTNVNIGAINFGIKLDNLFKWDANDGYDVATNSKTTVSLADEVLKKMVFGVKFDQNPIQFAMQFNMDNYQAYLGVNYDLGPATIGASFMGELNNPDKKHIKAGVKFDYNADLFGILVRGKLENETTVATNNGFSLISIEPIFFYNAIPSYLQFNVKAGFYFDTPVVGGTNGTAETYWGIQPALFYSFTGAGATGDWWPHDGGTSLIFRYRMMQAKSDAHPNYQNTNALDLIFKFGF
jgi:hypothetical protein